MNIHELGQRIRTERRAYEALEDNLSTPAKNPEGRLAPIIQEVREVAVEYFQPVFYIGQRVAGKSPEQIQQQAEKMLEEKKQGRLKH